MCGDPEKVFYPQRHVCYATVAREALNWQYDELYEGLFHDGTLTRWSNKRSVDFPNTARDGVTLWVAAVDLDPKREWLAKPPLAVHQPPPVDASEDAQVAEHDEDGDGGEDA